jgi:hypothetical protein
MGQVEIGLVNDKVYRFEKSNERLRQHAFLNASRKKLPGHMVGGGFEGTFRELTESEMNLRPNLDTDCRSTRRRGEEKVRASVTIGYSSKDSMIHRKPSITGRVVDPVARVPNPRNEASISNLR